MRLDEYTIYSYQTGDVIFAMRNGQPAVLIDPDTLPGAGVTDTNLANSDLQQTSDRTYDGYNFSLGFEGMKNMYFNTPIAPPLGLASYEFIGYGTTVGSVTHRMGSILGPAFELSGNLSARFYGTVSAAQSTSNPTINSQNSGAGSAVVGQADSGTGISGSSKNGNGVSGSSINSNGVTGASVNGKGAAFRNQVLIEEYATANEVSQDSALLELKSTTRGFLPPRMTEAQRLDITGAVGLIVYQTDHTEGLYILKSSGWVQL